MNQMKNISVASTPSASSVAQSSSQSMSTVSSMNDYELMDTSPLTTKKTTASIAAFPPRVNHMQTQSTNADAMHDKMFSAKSTVARQRTHMTDHGLRTRTPSDDGSIQFSTVSASYSKSTAPSM
jgi:hypothetical protein